MRNLKIHEYKGQKIVPCSYTGSKRWYLVSYHMSGTPYNEEHSRQFDTLIQVKREIDLTI